MLVRLRLDGQLLGSEMVIVNGGGIATDSVLAPDDQDVARQASPFHADLGVGLNQVERFFGLMTEKRIRRGVLKGLGELEAAIRDYLRHHNADPKPFLWTKSAASILEKAGRGRHRCR
jgi:hypothetical protein